MRDAWQRLRNRLALLVRYLRSERGMTLVELLLVIALIGIIMALTMPAFIELLQNAKIDRAIQDIQQIQFEIRIWEDGQEVLPTALTDFRPAPPIDPWGNDYVYNPFGAFKKVPKGARRDQNLVPVNSDYDLYSMGADGETIPQITKGAGADDIVRAGDGAYVGLGKYY